MNTEKNNSLDGSFSFYTEEQLIELSKDVTLSKKRQNKMAQISRLAHTSRCILKKMGFETESTFENFLKRGEIRETSLYDAYLVASFELKAARKKLGQMPVVPSQVSMVVQFFYEVQKDDAAYWVEMKEVAARRCAETNQKYMDAIGDILNENQE